MNKIGIVFLLGILGVVFSGCRNNDKDYAYNEATALEYKSVSDLFEKVYERLDRGYYSTKYEAVDDVEVMRLTKDVQAMKERAKEAQEKIAAIERSPGTDKFHETISSYFSAVSGEFSNTLESYSAIDCNCPGQKDSVISLVKSKYQEISRIEDKALEEQKIMFEKVGLKAK